MIWGGRILRKVESLMMIILSTSLDSLSCNGSAEGGSLWALFVASDWRVRVFVMSVLVDRPSGHLYVHTTPLSGYIDRRYHYIPFPSQSRLYIC